MRDREIMWKHSRRLMLLVAMIIALFMPFVSAKASSAMRMNAATKELAVGKTCKLEVLNTNQDVSWSTDKKKVATVNYKGVVTAHKPGIAHITARIGNREISCEVRVVENVYETKISEGTLDNAPAQKILYYAEKMYYDGDELVCEGFFYNTYQARWKSAQLLASVYGDGKLIAEGKFEPELSLAGGKKDSVTLRFKNNDDTSFEKNLDLKHMESISVKLTFGR